MAPTTLGAPCSGTSAHTLPAAGYTCEYGEALTSTSPGLKCRQADEHPQDATLNFCLWNVHKEADWTTGKKKPLSSPLNLLLSNVWLCVWWEMEEEFKDWILRVFRVGPRNARLSFLRSKSCVCTLFAILGLNSGSDSPHARQML